MPQAKKIKKCDTLTALPFFVIVRGQDVSHLTCRQVLKKIKMTSLANRLKQCAKVWCFTFYPLINHKYFNTY
jgi:hypothetical protein